jgi:hypothetical protein
LKIVSFIKEILGIRKLRIILQPRDGLINSEEAQELADLICTLNSEYKVDVAVRPEQIGKGVIPLQIVYIWIIAGSTIFVTKFVETLAEELAKIAIQWARDRFKKKGRGLPTRIDIYGPNGRVLKSVVVKDATQEIKDQTEEDRKSKMKRKPPLLRE